MPGDSLDAQARAFAQQTSDLLNHTVADGVRISAVVTPANTRVMGMGVTRLDPQPKPIPIARGRRRPLVWLYLIHSYDLDAENEFLTMTGSTISVYTSPQMKSEELVLGVDYVRDPANPYPAAHLHVYGQRDDLDAIYLGSERASRSLRDLHLPVGGRRFRPTLEDVVEFMITEEMVEPREGWEATIADHRARWEAIQLKAAIRRNPGEAAAALRHAGWSVTPPAD